MLTIRQSIKMEIKTYTKIFITKFHLQAYTRLPGLIKLQICIEKPTNDDNDDFDPVAIITNISNGKLFNNSSTTTTTFPASATSLLALIFTLISHHHHQKSRRNYSPPPIEPLLLQVLTFHRTTVFVDSYCLSN